MNKGNFTKEIISFINTQENKIANTLEEVSDGLYYSKAMRVVCVIDENFDKDIDDYLSIFNSDSYNEYYFSEEFETSYGNVRITRDETFDTTVTFAAEEDD